MSSLTNNSMLNTEKEHSSIRTASWAYSEKVQRGAELTPPRAAVPIDFDPRGGDRTLEITQILEGPLYVVSKQIFPTKDLFCSTFSRSTIWLQDLHDFCTAPTSKFQQKLSDIFQNEHSFFKRSRFPELFPTICCHFCVQIWWKFVGISRHFSEHAEIYSNLQNISQFLARQLI